jgi:hypothetical protein
MNAYTPGHAPDSQFPEKEPRTHGPSPNGKTLRYGIFAILGAIGCPPAGIIFAVFCMREPKRSRRWSTFARVVVGFVALSVVVYAFLFASGQLPLTAWMVSG